MAEINITSKDIPVAKLNMDALRALKESFPHDSYDSLARFLLARNNNLEQVSATCLHGCEMAWTLTGSSISGN